MLQHSVIDRDPVGQSRYRALGQFVGGAGEAQCGADPLVRGAPQLQTGAHPDPARHVVGPPPPLPSRPDARFILKAE
ncbi:hypothetical protein GCM10017557_81930 [Streptomyces aurantiacus]|uniref:Uncharacterized protein n=1 Tax=Streptomyces aurantiacus TaxID=47760 RepID=A0A7G1PGC3_9ACTN|nr:hypothetical protein GCM10017557_81930 [Streptomyces aurantiacus]